MNVSSSENMLSDKDFVRVSQFIHREYGIHLPPVKKSLLEGRLRKRMKQCGIGTLSAYCDYLFTQRGMTEEIVFMVDAVTTNKTDFFREPHHFEYLTHRALPELIENRAAPRNKLIAWSAACSTGDEPYTLAMVLSEFAETHPGTDFSIIATDISTHVLDIARTAIYSEEKIAPVPYALRKKYLLRSKEPGRKLVRIAPELRGRISFYRFNLMDDHPPVREPIDIVFCRNVMIYFDLKTQERLIRMFYDHLSPGGYLFMGHAEGINTMNVPFSFAAPTIYRKEVRS